MKKEWQNLSQRIGVISFFTFLSRLLGLVRDSAVAWGFGATASADAFYVAFRIPNLLRRLVAEGALTIAFVPVYTQYLQKSRKSAHEAFCIIFTYLSIVLTLLTMGGILFAPWIVKAIAWGFSQNTNQFELAIYLTRIMFPYIIFISLMALAMGVLNSLKHFAAPAAAPILLNVGIILGATVLSHFFYEPTIGLAIGVLIGGILQLLLQLPVLHKQGMLPRFNFNSKHPALKQLLLMMIPSAFGAAVYQINVMVVTLLASFLSAGSISYLFYSDRVAEFPLGIFSIAIATATLPTLSKFAANKDMLALKDTIRYSLQMNLLITIPASIGLYFLADIIIKILFERGHFTSTATAHTAAALCFFAFKIPFIAGVRNIVPIFFALKDAKTPVYMSTIALIINACCAVILMQFYAHVGLVMALTISSVIQFFLLLYFLRKRIGSMMLGTLLPSIMRIFLAGAGMGLFLIGARHHWHTSHLFPMAILQLFLFIFLGGGIYLLLLRLLSKKDSALILSILKRR